jgi:DNA-binding transcriptional LysR family regulator
VDLVTEERPIDIVAEGFDAGIRPGDMVPGDMIAIPMQSMEGFTVVGSPAYFEGRTVPETPLDLLSHVCIRARTASGSIYRWEFEQDGQITTLDVPGQVTLDDAGLMLEAVLAGAGLAYMADWWVNESIREGKLRQVLAGFTPSSAALCLYYSGHRHQCAALRALVSFIEEVRNKST